MRDYKKVHGRLLSSTPVMKRGGVLLSKAKATAAWFRKSKFNNIYASNSVTGVLSLAIDTN